MLYSIKEKILLTCLVFLSFSGFNQIYDSKPDALRNIEEGKTLLEQGDTEKAIEKFSFAINHGAEKSALLLRAEAYLKLADTCNSCKDFFLMNKLRYDTVVINYLLKICLTYDTIRSHDISLYLEYPKYNYTLLEIRKCTGDTILSYWDANDDFIQSSSATPVKYHRGNKAFNKFIKNNVRYPQEAMEQGIQGTIIIKFNVLHDGTLDNFTILKEIGGGCEAELIRVFKTIPKLQPATKNGIPIKTDFTYYFTWTIRN